MATHVPFQEPDVPSAQWSSAWICVARSKLTDGSLKEWPGVTRDKLRVHVQPTMMRRYHWCEGPAHVATRQMPNCGGTQSALGSAFVGALRFVGQPVWYRFRLPVLLSDVYLLQLLLSYWYWYSQVGTNILICTYLYIHICIRYLSWFVSRNDILYMECHVMSFLPLSGIDQNWFCLLICVFNADLSPIARIETQKSRACMFAFTTEASLCVCKFVDKHIYIYIYIHLYIHIYIYICMYTHTCIIHSLMFST